MAEKIENIINSLQLYDDIDIDKLWELPDITSLIFKNINVLKTFINYLIQTHKTEIIDEIFNYAYNLNDKDLNKIIDEFYFYEGKYTKIKLPNINEKMLNEILIFNKQPTKDEHFNKIFSQIKDYDIKEYKPVFDKIYLNARHNDINFSFIKKKYSTDVPSLPKYTNNIDIKYDQSFSNQFIMKYNHNNECFKRAFYALCSLKVNPTFKDLLNTFINFESLFYSKIVQINDNSANLITYIYFKNNDTYIPNIRYTLDIPGNDIPTKIEHLKHVPIRKTPGFITEIANDDKGIYFSTHNYDINEIIKHSEELISNKKYDELLYYIFNSQFLSRSTCLFGYYLYFKLTNKIPNDVKYYDIIALTQNEEEFYKSLNFKTYSLSLVEHLTLNQIIEFILSNE